MRQSGFNLIELTVTILILGILAVVALPRFFDRRDFDSLKVYDQTIAAVRYAQKVAVAQHVKVFVVVGNGSLAVCFDKDCVTSVTDPSTGNPFVINATLAGVTLATSVPPPPPPPVGHDPYFSFDALGKTDQGAAFTVTVNGTPVRTLTVEAETGYVHP